MYFYRGHLYSNIYTEDYELDYDDLYCEQCGDSDDYLGEYDSWADYIRSLDEDEICSYPVEYFAERCDLSKEEIYNLNPKYFDANKWDDEDEGE